MLPAALLTPVVLIASIGPARAQGSACTCADVADLRNRLCEARAAIAEYGKQITMIRAQEKKTGVPVMYTVARYKEHVQPCVQEAMNQVTDPKANRPTADTDGACEITYKGNPTGCLKQVLGAHEREHVRVCRERADDRARKGYFSELRGFFADFREGMTLVDLLNEERVAYQIEIHQVRGELERLSRNHPPCAGLPPQPPGPPRIPTIEPCPPPRPRPAPKDSECQHR
jgi:hypothetical protein